MEDSNISIKICPYVKRLISIRKNLSAGMDALTSLCDMYGDERDSFSADDFLETRDILANMANYVSGELFRIIGNRINQADNP